MRATKQAINVLLTRPAEPFATLVLAHGAGSPMDSPFMETLAHGLCANGVSVVRFEFSYMQRLRTEGRLSPPDRMPALEARFREVIAHVTPEGPLFVGGKSLGSRVAARIADDVLARAVIAFGYPFHPPRRPDKLRVDVLQATRTPALIVQGTRDPLGAEHEVRAYDLPAHVTLHWVADGDHSFAPRQSSGRTLSENMAAAIAAAVDAMRSFAI